MAQEEKELLLLLLKKAEEKAKRYDEALEIAKKNYVTAQDLCEGSQIGVECFKNTLESIFQELKESEDDRIRKELTEFLKKASGGFLDTTTQCKTFGKWRNWLEKQGEQKPAWSEDDEKMVKDIIAAIDSLYYHGMVKWLKSLKERIG